MKLPAAVSFLALLTFLPGQERTSFAELTEANYAAARDFILPSADETAWLRIGWHGRLDAAMRAASAADKPILLWAMNGHPLGCV